MVAKSVRHLADAEMVGGRLSRLWFVCVDGADYSDCGTGFDTADLKGVLRPVFFPVGRDVRPLAIAGLALRDDGDKIDHGIGILDDQFALSVIEIEIIVWKTLVPSGFLFVGGAFGDAIDIEIGEIGKVALMQVVQRFFVCKELEAHVVIAVGIGADVFCVDAPGIFCDVDDGVFAILTPTVDGQRQEAGNKNRNKPGDQSGLVLHVGILPAAHGLGPVDRFGAVAMFVPDEFFHWRAAHMVIEQSGAFVKALRMKRIGQLELFDIDVVAELMA